MTTKITEKNISNLANFGIQWQSVITADGSTTTTAVAGRGYLIDTTSNAHTINLPASAIAGDTIAIKDYAGTFGTNALTISRNGSNIQGAANNSELSTNRASVELIYVDSTKGWVYTNESNVADLGKPLFTSATGGTITTSGDYKIHTFTGDGCFVVSQAGNSSTVPTGGPNTVSYLVIAGGAAGANYQAGGGGAGGFREGRDITPSYTASPLVAPTGLTITATTYPVTVGGGGSPGPIPMSPFAGSRSNPGSPSVFSTITSTGGGGASFGSGCTAIIGGGDGGSGGGGGGGDNPAQPSGAGSGNNPPTSPPQGNPGGAGKVQPAARGGGGGGAGAAGCAGPTGNGGAGVSTSITGSPVTRAGGGGGGGYNQPGGSGGPGGGGAGGPGSAPQAGGAGSVNTGSGGGGGGRDGPGSGTQPGGAGGKGIVVIRYKFQ